MSNNEIITTIKEMRELQALIEEAQAEVEAKKDIIKSHMGNDEELRAGEYKVTWKSVTSNLAITFYILCVYFSYTFAG